MLNNYALSEYEGKLRVATTEEPTWIDNAQQTAAQSTVTVLDQQGNKLVRVGSVSGLGQGERIYAVRFLGDKGYVVTFRQVDPLYTLDLSDATAPKVAGELKIPGFSSYLHPVGESKLLGIGYEGADVQASLFDVANPASPQRLAVLGFGPGSTTVGQDSHAFLYSAKANLAVIPLQTYGMNDPGSVGAAGIRIGANTLSDAGRVKHSAPSTRGCRSSGRSSSATACTRSRTSGSRSSGLGDMGAAGLHRPFKRGAAVPGGEGYSGHRSYEGVLLRDRRGFSRGAGRWSGGSGGCRPRPRSQEELWTRILKRGVSRPSKLAKRFPSDSLTG